MRILYVEDNEINQALVERVIRAKQHTVLFREDGEGALALLAEDSAIDLVLLDIELAGAISGTDVIRTLRSNGDTRPVVAVTAYAMMGDRERFLEAGCNQYLPKPLNIVDLLAVLDEYDAEQSAHPPADAPAPAAPASPPAPTAQTAPPQVPATPPDAPAPAADSPPPPPREPASPTSPGAANVTAPENPPPGNGRAPAHEEKPA